MNIRCCCSVPTPALGKDTYRRQATLSPLPSILITPFLIPSEAAGLSCFVCVVIIVPSLHRQSTNSLIRLIGISVPLVHVQRDPLALILIVNCNIHVHLVAFLQCIFHHNVYHSHSEDYSLVLDLQSDEVSVEPVHSHFNAVPMTGRSTYMFSTPQKFCFGGLKQLFIPLHSHLHGVCIKTDYSLPSKMYWSTVKKHLPLCSFLH